MSVTLLITDAFVNFFAVHDTKHLKLGVQRFESQTVFGIEEYIRVRTIPPMPPILILPILILNRYRFLYRYRYWK